MEASNLRHINQEGSMLYISFNQQNNSIGKLYVKNEFHSISYNPVDEFCNFEIDLNEILKAFKSYNRSKIFLIMEESDAIITTQKNIKVTDEQSSVLNLSAISDGSDVIHPYITKNGFLHLSMESYVPQKVFFSRRHIDALKFNNSEAYITGEFSTLNAIVQKSNIVIRTRFTERETEIPLPITLKSENKRTDTTNFKFSVDIYNELIDFMKYPFETEDVIDIYLKVDVQESAEPLLTKLGNPRIFTERFLKGEIITDYKEEIVSITPYFTMKGRNLSFRINRYSIESYLTYLQSLKTPSLKNLSVKSKNKVWIIGEKSYKAQDNGYHFFKYMRTYHPELPVYYIIDEHSNEAKNVLPFGNVIYYQSPEHFSIMLQADYICSTHHPELLFPTNSAAYTRKITATRVFLQHGVLGTKNLTQINGNQLKDFNVDVFITSSEREKEIVVRDLNFDEAQVKVTGLARFDELFNKDIQTKNQILIMPTWRDWLTNYEQLESSEYLERMNTLINSDKVKKIAEQGTKVIFCLHPNMQPFIDLFDVPQHVTSIKQGDVNVQQLIQESKLMITDYSSVAFDFSFLGKPVIYYQFDKDHFLGKEPSHINVEEELPGLIVNNQNDLEAQLTRIIANDYTIDESVNIKAQRFNNFNDRHNSARIYTEVTQFKTKNQFKSKLKYDILSQHLFKRFRRDKRYFKVMDKYNSAVSKMVPVKKDLVVFESNVGKSVSDSPKVIYEALKQHSDQYQIVWVSNTQYPFNDANVKSIKRLSPEYYHYLSRAKYWINNQNFPYYINKPKDTLYIQTWHGTPLKKMLNDIETFAGRDDGYKNRINHAIKYWDYLVSPSPYATECFKSAFDFHKEILEVGYPRNDVFYQDEAILENESIHIKQKLGIHDDRKIILYAPTFRDDELTKAKKHIINLQIDLYEMQKRLSDDYILILRPHIIISNALQLDSSLDNFVINGSDYNEISDLYLIADICITDYSSVMFDYANTKKPLLFFTYDLEHYKNSLRGFYFDFENQAPGPLLKTNEDLIQSIEKINQVQETYKDKYDAFYNRFCTFETGTAAKSIVQRFF